MSSAEEPQHRQQATALDRRFAEFGLTIQRAALLLHASQQPTSPSRLAELVGTDMAGMTRLVDRLEAKSLLRRRRHADDRRAVLIEITADGRALLPRLPPVFGQITGQLFAGFTPEEIDTLAGMCQRMLTNLTDDGRRQTSAAGHEHTGPSLS